MNTTPIGNEEQMAQIKALMETKEKADEVKQGDKATNVVSVENYEGDSGRLYSGKFIFKRPNVMESLKMGGRKTQILQEAGIVDKELADNGVLIMAQAISTLEAVVVKCPEWFVDMEKMEDTDVIFHVYGLYREWNYNFRADGAGAQAGNS